jgi:hypothetical protein
MSSALSLLISLLSGVPGAVGDFVKALQADLADGKISFKEGVELVIQLEPIAAQYLPAQKNVEVLVLAVATAVDAYCKAEGIA